MLSAIRRHLSYANVVATLALVFAMSGAAVAANHYLIKSTNQISPNVLKTLKGRDGKNGRNGAAGPAGPAGATGATGAGATGATGATGPSGGDVATVFSASKPTPTGGLGSKETELLFKVDNVEAELYCVSALSTAMSIRVYAPEGSVADTGLSENTTEGKSIGTGSDEQVVENVELFPEYLSQSGGYITNLESTSAEPKAAVAHLTGAITTPDDVITLDAYMKSSAAEGCSVRGTAITTPR